MQIYYDFFISATISSPKMTRDSIELIVLVFFLIFIIYVNRFGVVRSSNIFKYFVGLFLHIYIFYRISAFMKFLPDFTTSIFYANFIFYSHLKMTLDRLKRHEVWNCCKLINSLVHEFVFIILITTFC